MSRYWISNTEDVADPPTTEAELFGDRPRQGVVVSLFELSEILSMASFHDDADGRFKDYFENLCDIEDAAFEVRRKIFEGEFDK